MLPVLVPAVTSDTEKADVTNCKINNTILMFMWPKLIIKNFMSTFKLKKLIESQKGSMDKYG